ncbi:hypothetical protein [Micromonospora sp. KC213]|uniref:hypothetical protein n=1 Tax=Micromonospora sp. KC213 TaxID=2530378 RepID=UPI00104F0630|nr:hypothetical protein [Micromonospora sp. KC213]TDC28552.1 hypothetical protein E1166_30500 [Micromonospora sp. KC213]
MLSIVLASDDLGSRDGLSFVGTPIPDGAELAQPLWDRRARSYAWQLWQAAHLIDGGWSAVSGP